MRATRIRMQTAVAPAAIKPLIKRPPGCKYKTVLSVDGGGIKGIIPATVLRSLETSIKDHIFENSATLIPAEHRQSISSTKDFNVDLTDYFDLVAGTSIGSWIALYIAGRGRGSEALFKDKDMSGSDYGDLRPGSMETIQAVFKEYGREVFPRRSLFDKTIGRILHSLYPSDGLERVLKKVFGDAKFNELETGCLVMAFDLERNFTCRFMRDVELYQAAKIIVAGLGESPGSLMDRGADEERAWNSILTSADFYLRDVAHASSAAPTFFAPAKIKKTDGSFQMTMVDGGMVANNPTLMALTYFKEFFKSDIRNIAVFSVGCGTTDPDFYSRSNPGAGWWLFSGYLVDIFQEGTGEYIQRVMEHWLHNHMQLPRGQFVRIQRKAYPDSEEGKLVGQMDRVDKLMELQQLGEKMAHNNSNKIKNFVKDFIFQT